MKRLWGTGMAVLAVSVVLAGTGRAGDAVKSGLKPGAFVSPFDVEDITGPNQGKTLCYR